ncbi:MAG: beta-ketoacyl-[acyl-carrier-protein] synthase family protein [Clostridia bacterium]|nr:beta-ketoacyl-[acyl-carrier-protein] synthase family protein [Clostridia bacterium]
MTVCRRVVVTGVGIYSSMGRNKDEVLDNMKKNATGIGEVSRFSTDQMISKFGAEIKDYVAEAELSKYNKCTQFGIHAAKEALKDSGLEIKAHNADKFALCFGTCNGGIAEFEKAKKLVDLDYECTINFPLFQQGDCIAEYLGIKGSVISNVTACAASGHSLSVGYELLSQGKMTAVLVGGADTLSETVYAGFNSLHSLSTSPCAPFGYPTGLTLGEGAAFIILENLERALERNAYIYAEICGYGLDQDAHHITAPHPEGDGVARAVTSALDQAEVNSKEMGYINVHGTGTEANDACEIKGLKKALGSNFPQIPLSSGKGYFGHTLGAAAVLEMVSSLIAIKEGLLPATLHTKTLREGCTEANHILNEMIAGCPQYYLCNNSAFGGHNSSVLFKNWQLNQVSNTINTNKNKFSLRRVGILGISMVNQYGHISCKDSASLKHTQVMDIEKTRKEVKEYIASLYARRMSIITQYSIAGILRSLEDANIEVTADNSQNIGLIFGTMYGASESFCKYLKGIFEQGSSFASALYFPDTSANTTPGSAAIKLGIKGSGTTISTGGNEGLLASYIAYNLVRNGSQQFCLAGAAEEVSSFSNEVNRVLGFDKSKYPITEGSSFMVLGSLEEQDDLNTRCYAEIRGFGFSFGIDNYQNAILCALNDAGVDVGDIDFVFYNDDGLEEKGLCQKKILDAIFSQREIPVKTFNDVLGYALSVSSMYHINLAADWLFNSPNLRYALVVSSSYNGGNAVMVIGRGE